mmetsp:Transcript_31425/g.79429  ORF Transcript_31425/g.79429 Transcript_31425/m.79429 type:complete len:334 (+) Transcript_31425:834-1835(+)
MSRLARRSPLLHSSCTTHNSAMLGTWWPFSSISSASDGSSGNDLSTTLYTWYVCTTLGWVIPRSEVASTPFSRCARSCAVRPLMFITLTAASAPSQEACHTLAKEPEPRRLLSVMCPMSIGLDKTIVSSMRSFCCSRTRSSELAKDCGTVTEDATVLEAMLSCRLSFLFKRVPSVGAVASTVTTLSVAMRSSRRFNSARAIRPAAAMTSAATVTLTAMAVTSVPRGSAVGAAGGAGEPEGDTGTFGGAQASTGQRDQRPCTKQPTKSSPPYGFRHELPSMFPYRAGYVRVQGSHSSPVCATETLPVYIAPLSVRFWQLEVVALSRSSQDGMSQ